MTKINWCYKKNYEKNIGQGANTSFPHNGVRMFLSHKHDKRNGNKIVSLVFRFGEDAYKYFSLTKYVIYAIDYCERRVYFTTGTEDNGYKLYNQPRMKDSMEFKRDISQIEEYNIFPYCGVYLIHQLGDQNVYYISFDERIRAGR